MKITHGPIHLGKKLYVTFEFDSDDPRILVDSTGCATCDMPKMRTWKPRMPAIMTEKQLKRYIIARHEFLDQCLTHPPHVCIDLGRFGILTTDKPIVH
jgi:hypothetical protein